jgi:hypothetical protein
MNGLFKHRAYLRHLSQRQRRAWFEQWKHARPRVRIGAAYLPPCVARTFAYVKLS